MTKYKHLVTLLTSSDLDGLKRLVYAIENDIIRAPSLETEFVIVVNTLDDTYYDKVLNENFALRVVSTSSNGTAPVGKNSCHELLLESDCDYLTQFDADDLFYPTVLLSLAEHLRRMPCLDVLGILPLDILQAEELDCGYRFKASDDLWAAVWGVSLTSLGEARGVGRHKELYEASGGLSSQDKHILYSRKACEIMMDETMILAEDHLQSFKYLGEHQNGNLLYTQTLSSDMYIQDRSFPDSVQKRVSGFDYVSRLQEEVPKYVEEWRSSFGELPCLYIDLMMHQTEKEIWMQDFLKRFENSKNDSRLGEI